MDVLGEQHALKRDGLEFASRVAASEVELTRHLIDFMPDVVLCDYTMPGFSGPRAIDTVRRLRPSIPILMVSGSIADETAIECLNRGAADYLLKSNLRRLGPAVRRVVADTRQRQALEARIDRLENYDSVTGMANLAHVQHAHARRLEIELQGAIALDGLSLCYQPQFDIRSGRVCGVEALARWVRADGGTIPPSVFISLAEQADLIRPLGAWALREGCKTAAEWLAGGAPTPTVSINVSPRQICEEFTAEIARWGARAPREPVSLSGHR